MTLQTKKCFKKKFFLQPILSQKQIYVHMQKIRYMQQFENKDTNQGY